MIAVLDHGEHDVVGRQAMRQREGVLPGHIRILRALEDADGTAEIENLISELESLRDLLHAEGQRVQREISGYAQLSQAAMKSTRMIADNVAQWKRAADGLRNS